MTSRHSFFASESRALRHFADAVPGKGALTLLGAPMLAVVVTFLLQPKASGSVPTARATPGASLADNEAVDATDLDATEFEHETTEPFRSIAQALDNQQFVRARQLLAASPLSSVEASELRQAYELTLDCLEAPSNDTTARAYKFYLEQAPISVRPRLRAACLPTN